MARELIFERKLAYNAGSYKISIPIEIIKAMELKKGDVIAISYEDGSFICRKKEEID